MLEGFRDFVMRGNVIDLAITPDFGDAGVTVNGSKIVYGSTLTALIQFLIVAAVIYFVIVVPVTRLAERRGAAESESPAPSDENPNRLSVAVVSGINRRAAADQRPPEHPRA